MTSNGKSHESRRSGPAQTDEIATEKLYSAKQFYAFLEGLRKLSIPDTVTTRDGVSTHRHHMLRIKEIPINEPDLADTLKHFQLMHIAIVNQSSTEHNILGLLAWDDRRAELTLNRKQEFFPVLMALAEKVKQNYPAHKSFEQSRVFLLRTEAEQMEFLRGALDYLDKKGERLNCTPLHDNGTHSLNGNWEFHDASGALVMRMTAEAGSAHITINHLHPHARALEGIVQDCKHPSSKDTGPEVVARLFARVNMRPHGDTGTIADPTEFHELRQSARHYAQAIRGEDYPQGPDSDSQRELQKLLQRVGESKKPSGRKAGR